MPDRQITRCERREIIRTITRALAPLRMLDVTISLNEMTAKCCRAKSRVNMVSEVELAESSSLDSKVFPGEVSANKHKPWTADIITSQD